MTFHAQFTGSGTYFERAGSGPAVVFIHGLGCDLSMWTGLHRLWPTRTLITYDLEGHGRTALPTPQSLSGYVDQLRSLLAFNELRTCALVGFSMGGVVAASMAAAYPDTVTALVFANVPFRRSAEELHKAKTRIDQIRAAGLSQTIPSLVRRWVPEIPVAAREHLEDRLFDMLGRNRQPDFLNAYALALTGDDLLERIRCDIRCQSLIIGGTEDSSVRVESLTALSKALHASHAVVVEGAGHMLPIQCSSRFTTEIARFLSA